MSCRGFVAVQRLVLGAIFVTTAGSQASAQSPSLADRMGVIRRGWAEDENETANPPKANTQKKSNNGSILPNWFGRGEEQQQSRGTNQGASNSSRMPQNGVHQPSSQAQTSSRAGSAQRVASRPQTTQSQTTKSQGISLPGLGGTPLPQGNVPANQNAAASNQQNTTENDPNYPVIRDTAPRAQTTQRQTTTAPATAGPTRQSPQRHVNSQVDASELRRELTGGFSNSSNNGPVARTAQANDRPATSPTTPTQPAPQQTPGVQNNTSTNSPTVANTAPTTPAASSPARNKVAADSPATRAQTNPNNNNFARSQRVHTMPAVPSARGKEAFGEALQVINGGDPSVLVSNQTPVISSDIRGPKQVLVGREAVFRVRLQNHSEHSAEQIVASVRIPAWAEVMATTPTQGSVQPSQNSNTPNQLDWHLTRLEPHGSEVLDIKLIPRESKPMELGVAWTLAPVGSRAVVEVQEAKLKIEVEGPSEVLFDKPQVFQLTLSNPGTGPAEKVKIDLVPPGATQEAASSHDFGDLAAGESKTVEIELTAREAGKLMVKAVASAEGGLISDVSKEIFCRKPELELDWRGPATKYAGTPATYFFRVRNPGTAPAEDVTVTATLPDGAEFTSASQGQSYDPKSRQISWNVGTLGPGDDNYMELKCIVNAPGLNQLEVTAANAAGDLKDSKPIETNVVALADLKLQVSDPSGPVAVGSQAVYEIHVHNRGANAAKEVNIVALFSEGIEPDQAEGAGYTVADGRVSFRTIDELPAGRDVTLRIRAHALKAGTHVFRAEVLCKDLEIKLAAEETTRFYSDDLQPGERPAEQTAGRSSFDTQMR